MLESDVEGMQGVQDLPLDVVPAGDIKRMWECRPDVVHCHDWPTAPVTWSDVGGARTMFTMCASSSLLLLIILRVGLAVCFDL